MANRRGKSGSSERFSFLGLQKSLQTVTAAMKFQAFLGRKALTNLDIVLESRNITLLTNVHLVEAMVFLVVMYGCEG